MHFSIGTGQFNPARRLNGRHAARTDLVKQYRIDDAWVEFAIRPRIKHLIYLWLERECVKCKGEPTPPILESKEETKIYLLEIFN